MCLYYRNNKMREETSQKKLNCITIQHLQQHRENVKNFNIANDDKKIRAEAKINGNIAYLYSFLVKMILVKNWKHKHEIRRLCFRKISARTMKVLLNFNVFTIVSHFIYSLDDRNLKKRTHVLIILVASKQQYSKVFFYVDKLSRVECSILKKKNIRVN